jgi:hypothetical protein
MTSVSVTPQQRPLEDFGWRMADGGLAPDVFFNPQSEIRNPQSPGQASYVIASGAKQSPIVRVENASSLRSSQ